MYHLSRPFALLQCVPTRPCIALSRPRTCWPLLRACPGCRRSEGRRTFRGSAVGPPCSLSVRRGRWCPGRFLVDRTPVRSSRSCVVPAVHHDLLPRDIGPLDLGAGFARLVRVLVDDIHVGEAGLLDGEICQEEIEDVRAHPLRNEHLVKRVTGASDPSSQRRT